MVWFLEYSVSDSFAYCETNNCLVGWTVDRSIDQLFGRSVGRSVDSWSVCVCVLVSWSVDWSVGLSVDDSFGLPVLINLTSMIHPTSQTLKHSFPMYLQMSSKSGPKTASKGALETPPGTPPRPPGMRLHSRPILGVVWGVVLAFPRPF